MTIDERRSEAEIVGRKAEAAKKKMEHLLARQRELLGEAVDKEMGKLFFVSVTCLSRHLARFPLPPYAIRFVEGILRV